MDIQHKVVSDWRESVSSDRKIGKTLTRYLSILLFVANSEHAVEQDYVIQLSLKTVWWFGMEIALDPERETFISCLYADRY